MQQVYFRTFRDVSYGIFHNAAITPNDRRDPPFSPVRARFPVGRGGVRRAIGAVMSDNPATEFTATVAEPQGSKTLIGVDAGELRAEERGVG
mgnify:CR=1 FL=1